MKTKFALNICRHISYMNGDPLVRQSELAYIKVYRGLIGIEHLHLV